MEIPRIWRESFTGAARTGDLAAHLLAVLACFDEAVISADRAGRIVSWNPGAERLFGRRADEQLGRPIEAFCPLPPAPAPAALIARVLGGDTVRIGQARPPRGDATPVDVEMVFTPLRSGAGEIDGLSLVVRDLTPLKQAEAAAQRQRLQLQTLLETATDGIHVLDDRGRVVFFSHAFARMLGYSVAQMTGQNEAAWSTSPQSGDFADTMPGLAHEPRLEQTRLRRLDGSLIDVEMSEKTILLDGTCYVYRSARDIGPRMLAESERRDHLSELERVNRELDDFVYVASHDLRAPLRAIGSLVQWIVEDDPSLGGKTGERLQLIKARTQRMMRLLDDVMAYARVTKGSADPGPPTTAAALIVEVCLALHVPGGFRILTDRSLESISVRRMPLEQVFHNLLGNAVKHHDRPQGSIRVWATDRGARLRFFVAEREGSGMGLALVRKIVAQHGGECGIQAPAGRGTTVWFDWPKETAAAAPP